MDLKDQVCTFEQAKKLNELGIIQGCSLFFYDTWAHSDNALKFNSNHKDGFYLDAESCFSAFTVAELGIAICGFGYKLPSTQSHYGWLEFMSDVFYKTEAEARAAMLIKLIEKNITIVQEVNNIITKKLVNEKEK